MKHITKSLLCIVMLFTTHSYAQIATGYEVGTWYGFKKVAITYSFVGVHCKKTRQPTET